MSGIINIKNGALRILKNTAWWHLSYYLAGRGFPLAATFQLTNSCNLRCRMCNIPNNPKQGVLGLGSFKKIVSDLSGMGCCFASLSGGEVLTIPNFFEYLRSAKKCLPSVNFVTNGLLLDKAAASEAASARVDSVSISIDGLEKTHEEIRNMKGAFNKTLGAIENMKRNAPGVKIVVNTVIAPWNIDELKDLADFIAGLGVAQKFQPLNAHPDFDGQKKPYDMEKEKRVDAEKVEDLIRYLMTKKHVANSRYFLKAIPGYLAGAISSGVFDAPCKLPSFFCEFREDGMMYPCLGGTSWSNGFSVKDGVSKVFRSVGYREASRKLEGCRGCKKSYSVCYIEPRVTFPITNMIRYKAFG
ncbi:MAG: radical SAM protein [Deltaproteobacteria bacterium]